MDCPDRDTERRGASFLRRLFVRILKMTFAWAGLGILLGGCLALHGGNGLIGLISFTIAGQIVLGFTGFCLGCFFDRAIESVVGGLAGLLCGALMLVDTPIVAQVPPTALSLVIGALLGATSWPFISATTRIGQLVLKRASLLVR